MGLMGPSQIFFLPDKLAVIMVGMFFIGFVQALSFIPVLPEVVDMLTIEHKLVEGTDADAEGLLHDTIAALYSLWNCTSRLFSPIIGGFLFDLVGYKGTMNLSMVSMLIITAVFFYKNCGLKVYQITAIENKEVERLRAIKEKID